MQKISKSFDQKRNTINRITNKHQRINRIVFHKHIQLPILNHTQQKHHSNNNYNTISESFRNNFKNTLDNIINETLTNFKHQHQTINKIIFTSPITNRIGKIYQKSQQHYSQYHPKNLRHSSGRNATVQTPPKYLNSSLITTHKPLQQAYGIDFKSQQLKEETDFSVYGQMGLSLQRKKAVARNEDRYRRRGKKSIDEPKSIRFSPWNDQKQQDLF